MKERIEQPQPLIQKDPQQAVPVWIQSSSRRARARRTQTHTHTHTHAHTHTQLHARTQRASEGNAKKR